MNQAFYPIDLHKDESLLTGLLRMTSLLSAFPIMIISIEAGGRGVPRPPSVLFCFLEATTDKIRRYFVVKKSGLSNVNKTAGINDSSRIL